MSDRSSEHAERTGWRRWFNMNLLGVLILVAAITVSTIRVLSIQKDLYDPSKKVIRIAHWQLELGYRDALQAVIDEYTKLHPDVKIIQIPITEKVYAPWLNVQLLANTSPDLVELGKSKMANNDRYISRFFHPLGEDINKPNPYNKGTKLEGLPWRETFLDGMRGGYRERLQDYYSSPTSMFTVRIFYNKDLLREATGSDKAPQTMGELLKACDAIRQLAQQKGNEQLVPIAGSEYSGNLFIGGYLVPFTASFEDELDQDLSGSITHTETYIGLLQGKVSMQSPSVRGFYECMEKLSQNFPKGYLSVGREMAAFLFVQGNAGMIATGSWDGMSLFRQAKFDVGIMDFPLPAKGERWGEFIAGRVNEAGASGGANYGIYKYSKNVDIALDFMKFLTSQKYNEMLNQKAEWIPVTLGAKASDRMMPFMPDPRGYSAASAVKFDYGNYVKKMMKGEESRYLGGESDDYDAFAKVVEDALRHEAGGTKSWALAYHSTRRYARSQEAVLTVQSVRMLMDASAQDAPDKYRQVLLQQTKINNGNDIRHRYKAVLNKEIPED